MSAAVEMGRRESPAALGRRTPAGHSPDQGKKGL
jgi:hypothetical protein